MSNTYIADRGCNFHFWSYSRLMTTLGCLRKCLLQIVIAAEPTEKSKSTTYTGSFLHQFLEYFLKPGGVSTSDYEMSCRRALKKTKVVGLYNPTKLLIPGLNLENLKVLAYESQILVSEVINWYETNKGITEWFFERDYRVKKDFIEVDEASRNTFSRTLQTYFTGEADLVGVNRKTGYLIIIDYKYYEKDEPETHLDQLRCYNTVVPAVLNGHGFNITTIDNVVVMLKQRRYEVIHTCDYLKSKEVNQQFIHELIVRAKKIAVPLGAQYVQTRKKGLDSMARLVAKTPTSPGSACNYCNYKRGCKVYSKGII